MSDKKHIDRLFQERFKDFEATPSDAVWKNIEAELNKKKRRVIPIWWRYAGVAALLLLLLTVGGLFLNDSGRNDSDNIEPTQVVDTKDEVLDDLNKNDNNPLINSNKKEEEIINEKEAVAESNIEKDSSEKASGTKTEDALKNITPSNKTSVAENTSSKNKNESKLKEHQNSNKKLTVSNSILKNDNKTAIAKNLKDNEAIKKENEISQIDKNKTTEIINSTTTNNTVAKVNPNDVSTNSITKTNTVANNKEENITIEDVLDKNKDIIEEEKDEKLNRWSIVPNAAPVYFSSLGEGSSIDPQFNNNSKTGELNMSYGIKASYAVNKKLSIRTGVNKVNLGYNTNNVVVFQSLSASSSSSSLQNISASDNSSVSSVSVISRQNLSSAKRPEVFTQNSNTSINQDMGYIEVPLEIQYALTNKKLGINLIGGFSSLFLNKNEIFSENAGSIILLGEATNINKVSYSANFGLGFNYKFSKKIDLNLEPMFKYQINTFNNTSGNFKPYFIGVYTGFAIKF
ncbi:hypothetical protein L3X37_00360 [Sabulilitoribacter arenilitoris]|uniref:Outer membrane protein beta-barrel domain-containing protein n=1 Tax=Wocania arenilitoris TaxID=2044858 RepID=A0AAE3EKA2_9FLAO|nr:hypothetical protein [Wocania arenilitoris]MCF7566818.1 hypothetical protein [Wocania arenilitoris]